jgi:hypothetical protein
MRGMPSDRWEVRLLEGSGWLLLPEEGGAGGVKTGVEAQREFRLRDGLHAPNRITLASARTSCAVGRELLTASLQLATPPTLLGLAIGLRPVIAPGTPIAIHHCQAPCGTPLLCFLSRMRRRPEDDRQARRPAALRQAILLPPTPDHTLENGMPGDCKGVMLQVAICTRDLDRRNGTEAR